MISLANGLNKIHNVCNHFASNNIKNVTKVLNRNYSARRALLYVPGDSLKKLKKALTLDVDCITMDCEDGVALSKKNAARDTICSLLHEARPKNTRFDWAVRVNSIDSGLCDDDLKAVLSAKNLPDTVVIPKVDRTDHIKWFSEKVNKYLSGSQKVNLILLIESAQAMVNLVDICKTAKQTGRNKFEATSLIFGSDDFCASIGAMRTENSTEIIYARQKLVLIAKAFGLQAIDMVHIDYKDLAGLQKFSEEGMRMGYTGKQVIHPDQVLVVQKAFLPNSKQVQWATKLIEAFQEYQKGGIGAFTFQGSMIDMPTVKQAENILKLVQSTKRS